MDKLQKDSKNLEYIFSHWWFKDKDSAIRTLFTTLSLIEVLWNFMLMYETCILLQAHSSKSRFSIQSLLKKDDLFKSFKSFFRNRTISYWKSFRSLRSKVQFSEATNKNADYVNFLMTAHRPGQLEKLSANVSKSVIIEKQFRWKKDDEVCWFWHF